MNISVEEPIKFGARFWAPGVDNEMEYWESVVTIFLSISLVDYLSVLIEIIDTTELVAFIGILVI